MRPANGGFTGIPRYARLLAEVLPACDPTRKYMAYAWRLQNVDGTLEVARSKLPGRALSFFNHHLRSAAPRWGLKSFHVFHGTSFAPVRFRRARTIATIHDCIWLRRPDLYPPGGAAGYDSAVRACLRFVEHVVTVSEHAKADICNGYGLDPDRITAVYPAVSPFFTLGGVDAAAGATLDLSDKPFILFVGDIAPRKNVDRVIRAFLQIADRVDHHLAVVGPATTWPKYEQSLQTTINRSRYGERIHMLGPVEDLTLRWLYRRSTAFVFPSVYEGFGLPLVEAMASGKAIVTSNVTSMPEVVNDAAILIDPLSVDQIASALDAVINDDRLRMDLERRALDRAQMFTPERFSSGILDVYRRLGA